MVSVKLVTFDVTGTLLFFRTPIIEKYISTGLKYGIEVEPTVLKENFRDAWKSLNSEHPNFGRTAGLGWQNWWTMFVERAYAGFKNPNNVQMCLIAEDLLKFHTTAEAFTIRPGTTDLLCYLKGKGVQLGVISNYDGRLKTVLDVVGIKNYFDFILSSYEVGWSKPDKRIFEEALRLGNCSRGSESIHIGDDVELDYMGAKNAGMGAILISDDEKVTEREEVDENEVFCDFFSLKNYFQAIHNC